MTKESDKPDVILIKNKTEQGKPQIIVLFPYVSDFAIDDHEYTTMIVNACNLKLHQFELIYNNNLYLSTIGFLKRFCEKIRYSVLTFSKKQTFSIINLSLEFSNIFLL